MVIGHRLSRGEMMMKNEKERQAKNDSGMPDVGEVGFQRKLIVGAMFGVVLTAGLVTYLWSGIKAGEKLKTQTEEIYTVQSEPHLDHKLEEITPKQAQTIASKIQAPQINPELMQQQLAILQAKQKELQQRLAAPLMIVNVSQASNASDTSQQTKTTSNDQNTAFMQQVSAQNIESVTASYIGPLNTIIASGSFIHANLESASNSDLPGMLRASVSQSVYSEDGSQILIPVGSRLIGQYKSGLAQGQSRFFTVWTRLTTPNGFSIQLGSPGVDSLGVAGMNGDEINRHFWERFGSASLLSLIGAGASNLGVKDDDQNNSASSYREAVANSFAQSASQSLQQDNRIAPTLRSYQGKHVIVFVSKDLHFQDVMKSIKPKLNVF